MQDLNTSPLSTSLSSSNASDTLDEDVVGLDRVLGLLLRDRAKGGYGGRVTFSEFGRLAQGVGWTTEAQEDIWYDLVRGVPIAETHDVNELAKHICQAGVRAHNFSMLVPLSSTAVVRPSTPPAPQSSSPVETHRNSNKKKDTAHGGVVVTEPGAVPVPEPATAPPPPSQSTTLLGHDVSPRYALPTSASAYRTAHTFLLQGVVNNRSHSTRRRQRHMDTSSSGAVADKAPAPTPSKASVFERLYPSSARGRETAPAATPATPTTTTTAPKAAAASPRRTRSAAGSGGGGATGETYNKPTQSYYARLLGSETPTHRDPISDAPATPRVAYHPAPGPSCCVPPGYVEGVARRRQQTAARFYGQHFEDTLRRPSFRNDDTTDTARDGAAWMASSPILRLPLSSEEGERGAVDVRLATKPVGAPQPQERPGTAGYCAIHLGHQETRRARRAQMPAVCASDMRQSSPLRSLSRNRLAARDGGNRSRSSRPGEHFKSHGSFCP